MVAIEWLSPRRPQPIRNAGASGAANGTVEEHEKKANIHVDCTVQKRVCATHIFVTSEVCMNLPRVLAGEDSCCVKEALET